MKCLLISILYFTLFSYTCRALDVYQFVDTKAYSMGNVLSVLPGFANPASEGFSKNRFFSLRYLNRYGIKELSTFAGVVNYPNKYLDAAMYISRFGFKAYHETMISLNVYKKLSSYISLGIRVNYLNLHYSNRESNKGVVSGDIGVLVHPLDNLNFSILAINPMRSGIKIKEEKSNIPVLLLVGASYQIIESFLASIEIEKDFQFPIVGKFGIEYQAIKQLCIRAGIYGKPFTPSFGIGVNLYPFIIDIAFSKHPVLGFRSCCGLQFTF